MSKVLILSTCRADMTAYGVQWPREGAVVAPVWDPQPYFGKGLFGILWGVVGRGTLLDPAPGAIWVVTEVHANQIVDLGDCVKFPAGVVRYAGSQFDAAAFLYRQRPGPIHGLRLMVGPGQTASVGDFGEAIAGPGGLAVAGRMGHAYVGDAGTARVGPSGTAIAGTNGTAMAGVHGRAEAGDGGTAIADHQGCAIVGAGATARAGHKGSAAAGAGGTIWVQSDRAGSWITGRVGENGILPGVLYHAVAGRLYKAPRV